MKIGDHAINKFEFESGVNKCIYQAGFLPVFSIEECFQSSHRGRANGDNPPSFFFGLD